MTDKLVHSITGFGKSHGTQNPLVVMLEKWKGSLDKGEYVSVLFMDLSKAFATINHDLLIAKLKAYGFSKEALKLMKSYLNPGKCYFMCIGKNVSDSELLNLNDLNLKNCKEVAILGITIDRNFKL